jgi:hypothetical protein
VSAGVDLRIDPVEQFPSLQLPARQRLNGFAPMIFAAATRIKFVDLSWVDFSRRTKNIQRRARRSPDPDPPSP